MIRKIAISYSGGMNWILFRGGWIWLGSSLDMVRERLGYG